MPKNLKHKIIIRKRIIKNVFHFLKFEPQLQSKDLRYSCFMQCFKHVVMWLSKIFNLQQLYCSYLYIIYILYLYIIYIRQIVFHQWYWQDLWVIIFSFDICSFIDLKTCMRRRNYMCWWHRFFYLSKWKPTNHIQNKCYLFECAAIKTQKWEKVTKTRNLLSSP